MRLNCSPLTTGVAYGECAVSSRGVSILLKYPASQLGRFFGVASYRKSRARKQQTVWASVTHNTHDHTASKGVSDRLGRGITRASSTFPSALAQNRAREYTPREGVGWTYQPGTDVSINGLAGPLPDRRDIRGKLCLKEKHEEIA